MLLLNDLLNISDIKNVKIRFNMMFDENWNPIELFLKNDKNTLLRGHYHNKQKHKSYKVGQITIGLIRISPKEDYWLLFHIGKVTKDLNIYGGPGYEFEEVKSLKKYLGRVIVKFKNSDQNMVRLASAVIDECEVVEILDKVYDENTLSRRLIQEAEKEDTSTIERIKLLQKKYKDATPEVITALVNRIERGEIANEIKNLYGHKCLMCESLELDPFSFQKKNSDKLKGSKKYYVETHHIVPVSLLKKGSLGIENMITLCPNHHRQFHFGDVEIQKNTSKKLELIVDGKTKVRIEKKIEHLL